MPLKDYTPLNGGKYRIIRFINSGGFGCTYEAEHITLRTKLAIKEFYLEDYCNRNFETGVITVATLSKAELYQKLKQRFIDEARLLATLQHPGVVHVTDVFEENGTAYYVMEFIDGHTLQELVEHDGPLGEDSSLKFIMQICNALRYIHDNGFLHLDIKPSNIIIDKKGKAILIDFGTAKQFSEDNGGLSSTNYGLTPGYAAVEQFSSTVNEFKPATDIYALGATFYFMLTGKKPVDSLARSSGIELEKLPVTLSPEIINAIQKAMSLKADDRFNNTDDFLQALGKSPDPQHKQDNDPQNSKRPDSFSTNTHSDDETLTFDKSKQARYGLESGIARNKTRMAVIALVVCASVCALFFLPDILKANDSSDKAVRDSSEIISVTETDSAADAKEIAEAPAVSEKNADKAIVKESGKNTGREGPATVGNPASNSFRREPSTVAEPTYEEPYHPVPQEQESPEEPKPNGSIYCIGASCTIETTRTTTVERVKK